MAPHWLVRSVVLLTLACLGVQGFRNRWTFNMRYLNRYDNKGNKATTLYRTEERWFTQRLDHFQPGNTLTWKQRYWMGGAHHVKGGPVFLMIYGESEASAMDSMGYWSKLAQKYHALMFTLEHRFYGQSHPTRNMSVDNLKYLSSQQTLADTAAFIEAMNHEHKLANGTKWIAFGGSYAGNLAAWMRYKYPHLVHGAVASSAPLLAKFDFTDFFNIVEASLSTYGNNCVTAIKDANHELQYLLEKASEQANLTKKLGLCRPIDVANKIEVATLFDMLSSGITHATQYNDMIEDHNIKHVCDIMVNKTLGDPLDRYSATVIKSDEDTCEDFSYSTEIKHLKNITFWSKEENSSMDRQWVYQTCTEFGFYQTSETKHSLLGRNLPLALFIGMCADLFGDKFTKDYIQKATNKTNLIYGGLDIKATRVIYTHGSLDPWHALGITKTVIPESPAIFINGTSHCSDMLAELDTDPPSLKDARRRIDSIVGKWIR